MDNTSLDDFLATEDGADTDGDDAAGDDTARGDAGEGTESTAGPESDDGPVGGDPAPAAATDTAAVAPATTTSQWAADGVACAVCEAAAERVWESPDGLVCAACKEW